MTHRLALLWLLSACAQRPADVGAPGVSGDHITPPALGAAPRALAEAPAGTGSLFGRVGDDRGRRLELAQVIMTPVNDTAAAPIRTLTDSAGAFEFPSVPVGDHTVAVRRIGYAVSTWIQRVGPGAVDSVEVTLPAYLGLRDVCSPVHGLELRVVDARTLAPAANGALAIAKAGELADTLHSRDPREGRSGVLLVGAFNREGFYDVVVTKSGYRPWSARSLEVTREGCRLIPRRIDVWLEPSR